MKKLLFKGSCTALVTPFDDRGKVNYNELEKMIEFQISNGTKALVILGTTGENATLTKKEKIEIIKFALKLVAHRVPIIAGAGSNSTAETIRLCSTYENLGVDGLLIVTPYYNKCTQNGLIEHYSIIASHTFLPIILYNVPSRTGVNLLPETVKQLSSVSNIVGIKQASGNIEQAMEIVRLCGDNITLYSGDDALTYPMLALGAKGSISVVGNIEPKLLNLMFDYYFNGQLDKAREIHYMLLPLIKSLFLEVNPIPIKFALKLYGFNVGVPRLPLTPLLNDNRKIIQNIYHELN